LKAITALIVLRDKAIKQLLAAAQESRPSRGAQNPTPLDAHYDAIRTAMRGVFHELGIAAKRLIITQGYRAIPATRASIASTCSSASSTGSVGTSAMQAFPCT